MLISFRPATLDDFDILCQLYYDFHQYHVAGVPDRLRSLGSYPEWGRQRFMQALEAIFSSSDSAIFLAVNDGIPIGLVEVYLRQDDPNSPLLVPRRYAYVQSLVVHPTVRGNGIGCQLMDQAEQWALERKAVEVRLNVWEFNLPTRRFYENLGYKTLTREMVKNV